ncbi:zinc finger BED domain-containing protein 4-like [Epinephelus moara]|uniref:zinc finger BED domain-containing protein 4-like n=1 Tax=Epinephelus moara TaxID=300413 RepID=UPI00214E386A|nr:zinc finger BED domain-containing protein 4-like [Epinephelus moara]
MAEHPVPKRSRSYAWEHFDLINPKRVKCLVCAQELTISNNTSSMLRHLRSKHSETTPKTAAAATAVSGGAETRQGRQAELDKALVDMVVLDTQPFKVVEDKGFRALVQKLDPTYILPTCQALQAMME